MCLPRGAMLALFTVCSGPGCDRPTPPGDSTKAKTRQAPAIEDGHPARRVKDERAAERAGRKDRARSALEHACGLGDADACISLAELLESSENTADFDRARSLYEQACAAGASEACDALGH